MIFVWIWILLLIYFNFHVFAKSICIDNHIDRLYQSQRGQTFWTEASSCSNSKLSTQVDSKLVFKIKNINKIVKIILRIKSGHCTVLELYRLKNINDTLCECGEDIGTIDHTLLRCSMYKNTKENLYQTLGRRNIMSWIIYREAKAI